MQKLKPMFICGTRQNISNLGAKNFEKLKLLPEKAFQNRSNLKWENKQKGAEMSINVGGGELRELKPRILVIGVGGKGNAINAKSKQACKG